MADFFYWFGVVHAVAYCAGGCSAALSWLAAYATFKLANHRRFVKSMIEWKLAKNRWDRRHADGLTEAEWQRGEPRP